MTLGLCGAVLAAPRGGRAGPHVRSAQRDAARDQGPFPADACIGRPRPINVLALQGVVRRDVRDCFGGPGGRAEGVPLELEIAPAGARGPLRRHAEGGRADHAGTTTRRAPTPLYDRTEVNNLRGPQAADAGAGCASPAWCLAVTAGAIRIATSRCSPAWRRRSAALRRCWFHSSAFLGRRVPGDLPRRGALRREHGQPRPAADRARLRVRRCRCRRPGTRQTIGCCAATPRPAIAARRRWCSARERGVVGHR